jgi:single-strand DNA-binding protein
MRACAFTLTFSGRSNNTMQKVMLIGNLGGDPEVKYSQQETAIAQFSVATTERRKDKEGKLQEHTEWFSLKAFGSPAEIIGEHLCKGSSEFLEGRKRTEFWDDKQTGAKHYRDLVYVDRIEFLDSKGNGNGHREPAASAYDDTTVTDQKCHSDKRSRSPTSIGSSACARHCSHHVTFEPDRIVCSDHIREHWPTCSS